MLLDLWGKLPTPGAVFADITWVGFTGRAVPEQYARAFAAARDGRDAAVELVQRAARERARAARLGSGSRRARRCSSAPATARSSSTAPATASARGARQRRAHGRLRNARRAAADARHRVHDRAGRLLRRVRRADRDQHVRRRARGDGDRARCRTRSSRWRDEPAVGYAAIATAPTSRSEADSRRTSMSTRKTTLFYAVLIAVASLAVGMVIASRLDLTPASSAQTVAVPPMNSAPLDRPDRRARRSATSPRRTIADGRQHPDRVAAAHAGPDRVLRRRRRRRRRPAPPVLRRRRPAGADAPQAAAAARPAGRRSEQLTAGRRHRLHHRQGRLHPHQQPRRRRGRQDRRVASTATTRDEELRGQGRRPRPADRQRAHPAHREADAAAAGSEVRRLVADAAGRLGDGDRQPVRPRPHRHASA